MEFEDMEQREWIRRLRASDPDPAVSQPIKLLGFSAGKYDNGEKKTPLRYDTTIARECSSALREVAMLDAELVARLWRT